MKEELMIALFGSIARIGLNATATLLERWSKPDATIDDAIKACREVAAVSLQEKIDKLP